ncbi:MAG: DUF2000 family protein [Anaerovoracaceae bacterium]|jgi:hypothetical protein
MATIYDTKVKIVLRNDLEPWQELNVTAFMMAGLGATQDMTGEEYVDASGKHYLPLSVQPIMVLSGSEEEIKEVMGKAQDRDMAVAAYAEDLFETFNDEDNRAAFAKYTTEELNLVGIAIRGPKNQVDRITKHLKKHD